MFSSDAGENTLRQYSKFDGFSTIKGLVATAKKFYMPAVGLTDHGTIAGVIAFLKECRKEDIRPIIGMEAYQSRYHKVKSKQKINKDTIIDGQMDGRVGNRHLNIIAKNFIGYQNLCELSQIASLEGYYYDPRIDYALLEKHKEGLICTSACLSNVINANLLRDRYAEAKKAAGLFKDIFGSDFYLEMMYHGLDAETHVLPQIQKLARELDIKCIATNDCHYEKKEDAEFQNILMCMNTKSTMRDPSRLKFPYDEFYFKSGEEMKKVFGHCLQSMRNTLEIAEKCDYSDIVFIEDGGEMRLPKFDLPDEWSSPHDYLEYLAKEGLKKKKLDKSPEHVERLQRELDDIRLVWHTNRYDFATYFLIVDDIMKFAAKKRIAAGIRGSGFGSLLLYCLEISEIDPVAQVSLLWERFLGFSEDHFICEADFGLKKVSLAQKFSVEEHKPGTATEVMFDRYH